MGSSFSGASHFLFIFKALQFNATAVWPIFMINESSNLPGIAS